MLDCSELTFLDSSGLRAMLAFLFEDTGEYELKGVPERWHLYRVAAQGV